MGKRDGPRAQAPRERILISEGYPALVARECPDMVAIVDVEGRFLYASPSYDQLGYREESLLGRQMLEFVWEGDIEAASEIPSSRATITDPRRVTYRHLSAAGDPVWVETAYRAVALEEGRSGILAVTREIEERKREEFALKRSERRFRELCEETTHVYLEEAKILENELAHARKLEAVGQLAAGIAHELNTPTQFVMDSLHFLREAFDDQRRLYRSVLKLVNAGNDLAEQIREAEEDADLEYLDENVVPSFQRCLDGLDRIATIVRSMREFAHPGQVTKTALDVNRALQNTLTISRNEYMSVAHVETEFGDLPPVNCHAGDINQVFLNLIVNAAHAIEDVVADSGEMGTLRIRTSSEGSHVRIELEDTGRGIPSSIQERVFEPFFTTKVVGKGTGQGLAIARNIIETQHSGSLTFVSVEGKGTTFTIRLPVE